MRHEGVTMDGCPVYNLAEFCLPGDRILGFRGVLNSTTNYVLDAMAEGASVDEAVAEAIEAGIAETDPSYDLEGHDAAAKVAALANVLLDADITPDDVPRDSLVGLTQNDVAKVLSYGRRLRLIAEAQRDDDGGSRRRYPSSRCAAKTPCTGSRAPRRASSSRPSWQEPSRSSNATGYSPKPRTPSTPTCSPSAKNDALTRSSAPTSALILWTNPRLSAIEGISGSRCTSRVDARMRIWATAARPRRDARKHVDSTSELSQRRGMRRLFRQWGECRRSVVWGALLVGARDLAG